MLTEARAADLLGSLASLLRTSRVVAHRTHGNTASGTQFGVLKLVAEHEVRLGDIASQLMVAPSVASRVVSALEAEGLVHRQPDPADARACLIGLTELGRQRLRERESFSLAQLRAVLQDWDDTEAADAAAVLRRLEGRVSEFVTRLAGEPVLGDPPPPTPPPSPGDADTRSLNHTEMEHQPV